MPFVVMEKDHDLNSGGSKFLAGGRHLLHKSLSPFVQRAADVD